MIPYLVAIVTFTGIYAMVALGLNIQWGMTGLINLGQVAFFAIGAYTSALLLLHGAPFLAALAAAGAAAGTAGALVAVMTPRLREDYLAIVTLGFSEIVRLILLNEKWLANGPDGIHSIPQPRGDWLPVGYDLYFMALTVVTLALLFLLSERVRRLPLGRVFRAIREDEIVVDAIGKPSLAFKVTAFALGAAFAGIGGVFYATYLTFIAPEMFTAHVSIYVLAAVLIGARGSNKATIVGTAIVAFLIEGTRMLKDYIPFLDGVQLAALRFMVLGLGLMAVVLVRYRRVSER